MPQSDGLPPGAVFAGYTIVRRLGVGGMGEVYLAQHPRLPRRDALKILPDELTANLEFRQRFNREADLAASLYNEHIVGIHDRGEYELDGRADQYALGCTAFNLLTGSAPFHSSNPAVIITQHLSAPPPPISQHRPELAELDGALAKALAKSPNDRYPTCADFAAALGTS